MEGKIAAVRISETKGEIKPDAPIEVMVPEAQAKRKRQGRPRGKYKVPQKPYVISLRISDDEMEYIQELMQATNKGASELMRDAFHLFKSEIVPNHAASAA